MMLVVVSSAVDDENRRYLHVKLLDVARLKRFVCREHENDAYHKIEHIVEDAKVTLHVMLGVQLVGISALIDIEHLREVLFFRTTTPHLFEWRMIAKQMLIDVVRRQLSTLLALGSHLGPGVANELSVLGAQW